MNGAGMSSSPLAGRSKSALSLGLVALAGLMMLCAMVTRFLVQALPQGGPASMTATDIVTVLSAEAAAGLAVAASVRSRGRMRLSWGLIAVGLGVWAMAEGVWSFYEVVLDQEVPLPSVADIGYLGAVPLLLAGIVLLGSPSRLLARMRTVLDAVAVALVACVVVWHQVLLPMYLDSEATVAQKVVGGAYPITDLVLFFGLALLLTRNRTGKAALIIGLFSLGLAVMLVADIGFAYLSLYDDYVSGSFIDLGWIYGYLLMGYAAALQAAWRTELAASDEEPALSGGWRQAVPLALIGVVFWQLVIVGSDQPLSHDVTSVILSALVVAAVVIRQAVVLMDNQRLNGRLLEMRRELEKRVGAATEGDG